MKDLTKAQIAIGLLAFFATVWVVALNQFQTDFINSSIIIISMFVSTMVLSYILLAILEWVNIFDLNTNAILTLFVNITLLQAVTYPVIFQLVQH